MSLSIKNGYVVYTRGASSSSEYWRQSHYQAISGAGGISSLYEGEVLDKFTSAGSSLISLAASERSKEIALLQSAGFNISSIEDVKIFIEHFNEILAGKQQFYEARNRIRQALDTTKGQQNQNLPMIASNFTTFLSESLNKNINSFIGKNKDALISQSFATWESELDSIIDKSIRESFRKMLKEAKIFEDSGHWKEVYKAAQQLDGFNRFFIEMIRSKIDFDRLRDLFKNETINIQKKTHRGVRKVIDSPESLNLKSQKKSSAIAGSVQEYCLSLLDSIGMGMVSGGRGSFGNIKGGTVSLFNYEANIDAGPMSQNLIDIINEETNVIPSLDNAVSIMDSYYNSYLSNLDNSFIIYGNAGALIGDSNVNISASGQLSEAAGIIAQAGASSSASIEEYVNVAYNTGEGAYFSGRRAEVEENLKLALMSAAATLLFEDWTASSGSFSGGNGIYVIALEGVNLPLELLSGGVSVKMGLEPITLRFTVCQQYNCCTHLNF